MQAYQTAPCPYCGATWNPPGAQTCANCRNQLPPPQAAYAPPGYAPGQPAGQPPEQPQYGDPNQAYPYQQPAQPDYGQAPPDYGQPPQPGYGQQPDYSQSPPPGYAPPPGYGYPQSEQPPAYPGYPGYPSSSGGYPGYPPPAYSQPGSGAPASEAGAGQTITILGQTFDLPFSLPANPLSGLSGLSLPRVRVKLNLARFKPLLYGLAAIAVVWVFLNAVVPVLADSNVKAADSAVAAAVAHGPAVDKSLTIIMLQPTLAGADPMTDAAKAQAVNDKNVADIQAVLDQLRADESTIGTLDQHLGWLAPVGGSRSAAIAAQRQRTHGVLVALKQADQVLSAAVDQGKMFSSLIASMFVWHGMWTDVSKRDGAGATALYPDAEQKLQTALALSAGPNITTGEAQYAKEFEAVLENTQNLGQAYVAKDNAGISKYSAAVFAAIRALQWDPKSYPAWVAKTVQPLVDGYHAGMRALKS